MELSQSNFNNIIDLLLGLETKDLIITEDQINFIENADFEGSSIVFNRDEKGDIQSFTLTVKEETDRFPFFSEDGLVFENEDITLVDTTSDFQVLDEREGLIVGNFHYVIRDNGQLVFATPFQDKKVLVSKLSFFKQKNFFLERNEFGQVTKISSEPISDDLMRTRQRLLPNLTSNTMNGVVKIWSHNDFQDNIWSNFIDTPINTSVYARSFEPNSDRTGQLYIEFPEPLILSDFEAKWPLIQSPYLFSFDVFGSNDKDIWERVLRVRNEDETRRDPDGKLRFDIPIPRSFKYYKFDILDWGRNSNFELREFVLYGYHPRDIPLYYNQRIMGDFFSSREQEFNGSIKVTENISNSNVGPGTIYKQDESFMMKPGEDFTFEFVEPKTVYSYHFYTPESDRKPMEWELKGSNNGLQWETVDHRISPFTLKEKETHKFDISVPKKFKYYRFVLLKETGGGNLGSWINRFNLLGE